MHWHQGQKIKDSSSLGKVQDLWNVKFPDSFEKIVMENNHAYPEHKVFDTKSSKGRIFGVFLNFDLPEQNNALKDYNLLKERLPEKVFPFGEDPAGNFICFDYRLNNSKPEIVFWNHEGYLKDGKEVYEIDFVAGSFEEFLNILYSEDSEDGELDFSNFQML